MNDPLKDITIAFFSISLFHAFANLRIEQAIRHDLNRNLPGGHYEVTVVPRGALGLLAGESSVTRVRGRGFTTDELPFKLDLRGGARARVAHLQVEFDDIHLRGLPIRRYSLDISTVSIDAFRAFFDDKIILRKAGEGQSEAVIDANGLQTFIMRKFPQLKNVQITLEAGTARVKAETILLGGRSLVESIGKVVPQDGRYLVVADAIVRLNGKETTPQFAQMVLKQFNPVLDIEKDLGLGSYLYVTDVEIGEGIVTVRGRTKVPLREKK